MFNQFIIDNIVIRGDRELLAVLVACFALLKFVQIAISLARSWFLMTWGMDVNFQWSSRVIAHMTTLPIAFFEKRHLGDVVSRFGSIGAIQGTDGLMAMPETINAADRVVELRTGKLIETRQQTRAHPRRLHKR